MRFLRVKDIQELTTLSRTTIWRLERAGKFPKGRSLPALPSAKVWAEDDVKAWMVRQLSTARQSRGVLLQPSASRSTAASMPAAASEK
jgi:predicted DNA-binding transcriptional regulator AlpA